MSPTWTSGPRLAALLIAIAGAAASAQQRPQPARLPKLTASLDAYFAGHVEAATSIANAGTLQAWQQLGADFRRDVPAWVQKGGTDAPRRRLAAAAFALEAARPAIAWRDEWLPQRDLIEWIAASLLRTPPPPAAARDWFLGAIAVLERASDEAVVFGETLRSPDDRAGRADDPDRDGHLLADALALFPDDPRLRLDAVAPLLSSSALFRPLASTYALDDAAHARLDAAAGQLRPLEAESSVQDEVLLDEGAIALTEDDFQAAGDTLKLAEATSSDPYVAYLAHLLRGRALEALGDAEGAADEYRAAALATPDAHTATLALASVLFRRGDGEAAAAAVARDFAAPHARPADPFETALDDRYPTEIRHFAEYVAALRTAIR